FLYLQAEVGIRDFHVTGVQTCALPIWVAMLCGLAYACLRLRKREAWRNPMKLSVSRSRCTTVKSTLGYRPPPRASSEAARRERSEAAPIFGSSRTASGKTWLIPPLSQPR